MNYRKLKLFALLIFFLTPSVRGQAQAGFSIFSNFGYAFDASIYTNNLKVGHAQAVLNDVGVTYHMPVFKTFFSEIGIANRTVFSSGKIEGTSFHATTLRLVIPLKLGVNLGSKWAIASGLTFQNNKDFTKIDLRENFFWRNNFTLEGQYFLKKNWQLRVGISREMRDLPDAYFINDPRFALLFGVAKRI